MSEPTGPGRGNSSPSGKPRLPVNRAGASLPSGEAGRSRGHTPWERDPNWAAYLQRQSPAGPAGRPGGRPARAHEDTGWRIPAQDTGWRAPAQDADWDIPAQGGRLADRDEDSGWADRDQDTGWDAPAHDTGWRVPAQDAGWRVPAQDADWRVPAQDTGWRPPVQDTGWDTRSQDTGWRVPARPAQGDTEWWTRPRDTGGGGRSQDARWGGRDQDTGWDARARDDSWDAPAEESWDAFALDTRRDTHRGAPARDTSRDTGSYPLARDERRAAEAARSRGHTPWEREAGWGEVDWTIPARGKHAATSAGAPRPAAAPHHTGPREAGLDDYTPQARYARQAERVGYASEADQVGYASEADQARYAARARLDRYADHAGQSELADQPGDVSQPGRPEPTGPRAALTLPRRKLLTTGGGLAAAFLGLEALRKLASPPIRLDADQGRFRRANLQPDASLPDIQFNIAPFTPPAETVDGILVAFPPVYTLFAPARLESAPTREDQRQLAAALAQIEQSLPFSPQGVFTFVGYGLPYFNRFPAQFFTLVPRLLSDESRFVLEEAVPGPTDVSPANPGIAKKTFNVPVQIEQNDLLFTLRSDNVDNLWDVMAYLGGSNMLAGQHVPSPRLSCGLTFTGARVMFVQQGLPRSVADTNNLSFARYVNPASPMWMGFADQQVNASAPAADVTFAGADGIHLTTAAPGDYFDNGSLQHLSHDILDMDQFFDLDEAGNPGDDGTFLERVQYMFRADPPPSMGFANQFGNGGGPAFLSNTFQGFDDAKRSAEGIGTLPDPTTGTPQHRMGHLSCLQRSSRTAGGLPIHLRMDGPGFDDLDVPDGSKQPKLQFTAFVPSAEFFATMRVNQASLDLQAEFDVDPDDNGLERFITATRRQNFLVPPRRHRAFPFAELGGQGSGGSGAAKRSTAKNGSGPSSSSGSGGPGGSGGGSGSGGSGGGTGPGGSGPGGGGSGGGGHGGGR
jgi:hypothetical protein